MGCGMEHREAHGMAPAMLTCSPARACRDRSENTRGSLHAIGQMEEVIIGFKSNYIPFGAYRGV